MNTKIFIAALIVSLATATLAFVSGLQTIFPAFIGFLITALISGTLTAFWITKPASSKSPRSSKKAHKPGKPINGETKEQGKVKWFSASKGFGFITRDNGEDIFVHFRSILGKGHRILQEGQRVEFLVTDGDKGLQAEEVSPV